MSAFELDYLDLVQNVIDNGKTRQNRNGHTTSVFGEVLRIHCLRDGQFPILTTRKIFYKPIFGELAAFLEGATDLATFKNYGCNYWDMNAAQWWKNEGLPTHQQNVGEIYGALWRSWRYPDVAFDQLARLIEELVDNPMSRRHLLLSYDPSADACLPGCHVMSQYQVDDGYLNCIVTMRSVDLCLGLPSDIVLYAALMIIICQETELQPGDLTFMLGDTHAYLNHLDTWENHPDGRDCQPLPTWILSADAGIDSFTPDMLELIEYRHKGVLTYELN